MLFTVFLLLAGQASLPSAAELIRKAIAVEKAQEGKGLKYTYQEDHEQYQLNKQNQLTLTSRKTYDVIMLEGDNYRKLILLDGKPLEEKLQKRLTRIWKRPAPSDAVAALKPSLERLEPADWKN